MPMLFCFEVASFQFTTEHGEAASFGKKWENTADFRGVRHMHWLSKLGYRMCYLCFHVEDFGDKGRGIRASVTAHEASLSHPAL
jgi:hypothetical protein